MSARLSASSGARSTTHEESFASALARGAPRTSTFTGGDGSGGSGWMWQATEPPAAEQPPAASAPALAAGHVTSTVTLSSSAAPKALQYSRTAAPTSS
eukprot:186966-Prymnesium_polylepis.1